MLKINENKTLKELRERGFYINYFNFYYEINSLCRIAFDGNCHNEDYLIFIGTEYSTLVEEKTYKKEIKKVLKELKDDGFILESK